MAAVDIEIWSDILCPFCYIGKRKLEAALAQFPQRDKVNITWRSFQLDSKAERNSDVNIVEKLAKKYGKTIEQAKQMVANVMKAADEVGLTFDYDKAIITNSGDAHRLIHLAAKHGLQDLAEEKLMSAYLCEGKHIGDLDTLVQIGTGMGLDGDEVRTVLQSDQYVSEVAKEQNQAYAMGVNGVPYFLFNGKFAVSGAQPEHVFVRALERAWQDVKPGVEASKGSTGADTCGPNGCG